MANAGRVAIVPKGDYSSSTAYKRLDLVRYNDKAYVAKKANTGIVPTNTEYWMLMTSDGIVIDSALSDSSTNAVQNKVLKSALDSIQTTSRGALLQTGWYRVAEYKSKIVDTLTGSRSNSCEIMIKRAFESNNNEYHLLRLRSTHNKQEFASIDSKSNYQLVTKVRYTKDESLAYLEIYYSGSTQNGVGIYITYPEDLLGAWQAITPTLTSETVSGVTVTTTYDIPANASPVNNIDLTTALVGYLKNTGGGVEGSLYVYGNTKTASKSETSVVSYVENSLRSVYQEVNSSGKYHLYDKTNSKKIFESTLDGTNTFNGTATGNLPLKGGTIGDGDAFVPLGIKGNSNGDSRIVFSNAGGEILGFLGFYNKDCPTFATSGGELKSLLHTGNSKPTVQSTTAPSDTAAIWIDTANKKLKAYIDGAWTVIA